MNTASQVTDLAEARLSQKLYGFGAARPHLAERNNFTSGVELVYVLAQFRQRNEPSADVRDLEFVLVTDIEQKEILPCVETLFQFFHLNARYAHPGAPSLRCDARKISTPTSSVMLA